MFVSNQIGLKEIQFNAARSCNTDKEDAMNYYTGYLPIIAGIFVMAIVLIREFPKIIKKIQKSNREKILKLGASDFHVEWELNETRRLYLRKELLGKERFIIAKKILDNIAERVRQREKIFKNMKEVNKDPLLCLMNYVDLLFRRPKLKRDMKIDEIEMLKIARGYVELAHFPKEIMMYKSLHIES